MWKITFFFSLYNFTWTETWWASGGNSLAAVQAAAISVAQTRAAMNAPQCIIQAIRLVNTTLPRGSYFVPTGSFAGAGTLNQFPGQDPDTDAAPQFTAIQVKIYGSNGTQVRRYFGGAPEGIVGTKFSGRNLEPLGIWWNALAQFLNNVATQAWSYQYLNLTGLQVCTAVVTSAQFPSEIGVSFNQQMLANPGVGKKYRMHFKNFRKVNTRLFGIGGNYTIDASSPGIIAAVAPFTYYLENTPSYSPSNVASRGQGCQIVYAYDIPVQTGPNSTGFSVLSANHRKRGVSALSLRGKSRSKP